MPPKVKVEADKTFSEDTVALILAVSGASLGMKEYEMMAKLGGGRTAGGYQHHFRSVKARARELAEQIKKNGDVVSTGPTKTPDARTPKKGGSKRKNKSDDDDDEQETPSKKVKAEADEEEGFNLDG